MLERTSYIINLQMIMKINYMYFRKTLLQKPLQWGKTYITRKSRAITVLSIICSLNQSCKPPTETVDAKFCLSPEMEKLISIDTARIRMVENELKLTGKITYNEENVLKVFPPVSGIVKEVKVGVGDHVQKGQVIAVIRSSEMAAIENDLNNAQSNYEIAQKNYNSVEDMYKGGVGSEKEWISAKKELEKTSS